jgi:hypothetical protein
MRQPYIEPTASKAFRGRIQHARYLVGCDLVDAPEARARLGVSEGEDVLGRLAKRKARGLAPGEDAWLIDLGVLAGEVTDHVAALHSEPAVVIIERGDSL